MKSIICFFCCPNLDYTSKFCTAHRCFSRKEHTREIVTLYEEQACYAATLVVSLHGFHGNKMDENAPCNFRIIFNVNVWGTAKIYKNNLKYMFGVSHIWVVLKPLPHDTYEPLFHSPQNHYCKGWNRHVWSQKKYHLNHD